MKYRIGKKQKRAILTQDGHEVVVFQKGKEKLAEHVCALLNESSRKPGTLLFPDDMDLATEVILRFISRNPHPKSKIYLQWEKRAFINGAKWMQEEIMKRNGIKINVEPENKNKT